MVVSIYEKFSNLLNSAAPDIYSEHLQDLESNNAISILSYFISSFSDKFSSLDNQQDFSLLIKAVSDIFNCVGSDIAKSYVEKISLDSEKLEQIQTLVNKSPKEFVDSFEVNYNPNNAYALLLIANLVDDKSMDLILSEILNQNLQSYFLDSDLNKFFNFTLQNYLDRKSLNVSHAVVSEELSKSKERVRSSERSVVKLSPLEDLLQRIKANKISEIELNHALSSMPALALKVATRFDDFGPEIKESLAKNILPKLENTPINNFCREIIEAKMPRSTPDILTEKTKPKQKTKLSKADIELEVDKLLKDEVRRDRITKEESKDIAVSVKDSLAQPAHDVDKIKAVVAKEVKKDELLKNVKVTSHSAEKISAPDKAIKGDVEETVALAKN